MRSRLPIGLVAVLAVFSSACFGTAQRPAALRSASMRNLVRSLSSTIDVREFQLPTEDASPRDPAVGLDGALWVSELKANKIARLDPASGSFREYALKTPDSGPQGMAVDADGRVWFAASYKGYIGRLDPDSGEVTEYPLGDRRAADPHTLVIAPDGTLWFAVRMANLVGQLDPRTGQVRLKSLPTPHAQPYGIAIAHDGAPVVCEFGTNRIARVDARTLAVREYLLPPGARPLRITAAPDGMVYYTDYARGMIARLRIESAELEEWQSPGGLSARPYAIAATPNGEVWYSESGVTPNTLVRFEPKTRRFAETTIPTGGGVVRNMAATPDGRLFLACSGTNRVAIAGARLRVSSACPGSPQCTEGGLAGSGL
jgi:virginiamycin B lyase